LQQELGFLWWTCTS